MVWISNQSSAAVTVQLTNKTGGSGGEYTLDPKSNETYGKNHWNRGGTEVLTITYSTSRKKTFNIEKEDHVAIYDDAVVRIPGGATLGGQSGAGGQPAAGAMHEPNQKAVYLINNGHYRIRNQASNTYLDVPWRGDKAGKAHGWAGVSDNLNQQWDVQMSVDNYYSIKNLRTGKYLNVEKINDGGRVITSEHPRLWEIRHNVDATAIMIPDNRAAIDLQNGSASNGAQICVYKIDYGKNQQRWIFESVKTTPWRH